MVVFDTATLLLTVFPSSNPPKDPETGIVLTQAKARVDYVIEKLSNSGETILIPTPVVTELLVKAGDKKDELLKGLLKGNKFKVAPFDQLAALELAIMLDDWYTANKPRDANETANKIKFDRQIAAIAKVNNAHTLYTDDRKLKAFAEQHQLKVILTWELEIPPPPAPKPPPKAFDDGTQSKLFGSNPEQP